MPLLALVLGAIQVHGALYNSPSDLPSTQYDFVIVGGESFFFTCLCPSHECDCIVGGAAGAVLANRLTEEVNFSVLLLEAGPRQILPSHIEFYLTALCYSAADREDVQIPRLWSLLGPGSDLDWGYSVIPQVGLNGRTIPFARGRALGGSTSTSK